jgi:hypothetical protein
MKVQLPVEIDMSEFNNAVAAQQKIVAGLESVVRAQRELVNSQNNAPPPEIVVPPALSDSQVKALEGIPGDIQVMMNAMLSKIGGLTIQAPAAPEAGGPTPYRFDVKRDRNGYIESVDAYPIED